MEIAELGFRVDTTGISKANTELDKLGNTGKRIGQSSEKTGGLISRSFRNSSSGITAMSGSAAAASGNMGLLKGAVAGVGIAQLARESLQYSKALKEVSTLVNTNEVDMGEMQTAIEEQSKAFGGLPTATAQAFYQAISAGASTVEDATAAVDAANNLAIGGATNTTTAVDGLTSAMNAYNGEAGTFTDISDSMFVAVKAGKTTVAELAGSIGNAAPLAAQAGVSLDELLASTAALTKGGVKTSVAMTGMRAIVAAVVKPTEEARKAAGAMGLDFDAAAIKSKGLAGFLQDVADKTGGSTEKMALLFGGVEALTPILALTGKSSGDFAQVLGDMSDKAGATQDAFEKMANSPSFQIGRIISNLAVGFLSLGTSLLQGITPALKAVADLIPKLFGVINKAIEVSGDVFRQFSELMAESDAWPIQLLRDIGGAFTSMAGYLAPLMPYLEQFGVAALIIGGAAGGVSLIAGALAAVAAVVLSPVVLGVAAIAAGAVLLREHWEPVSEWWAGVWGGIQSKAEAFLGWWKNTTIEEKRARIRSDSIEFVRNQYNKFVTAWNNGSIAEKVVKVKDDAINSALEAGKRLSLWWDDFKLDVKTPKISTSSLDIARKASDLFVSGWNKYSLIGKALPITADPIDVALSAVKTFKNWWDTAPFEQKTLDVITAPLSMAEKVGNAFIESWNESDIKRLALEVDLGPLSGARNAVVSFVSDVISDWSGMAGAVSDSAFASAVKEALNGLASSAVKILSDVIERIVGMFPELSAGFKEAIADITVIVNDFAKVWEAWFPTIKAIAVTGWGLLTAAFDIAWAVTVATIRTAWDLLTGTFDVLFKLLQGDFVGAWFAISETVVQFGTNLVEGFKGIGPAVLGAIKDMIETVRGAFSGWVSDMSEEIGSIPIIGSMLMKQNASEVEASAKLVAESAGGGLRNGVSNWLGGVSEKIKQTTSKLSKNAIEVGRNVAEGLPKGMRESANDANREAETLAKSVIGKLKETFKTRSPSKETEAIGAFVTQGLTAGMGYEADNLYSFTRQMSGEVLDQLGNMKDAANDKLAFLGDGLSANVDVTFNIDDSQFDKIKSFLGQGDGSGRPTSQRGHDVGNARNAADGQANTISDATDRAAALAQIEQSYQDQVSDIVRSGEGTRAQFREASFADQIAGTINKYSQEINIAGGLVDSLLGLETQKAEATAKASLTEAQTLAQAAADAQAIYESTGTEENRILAANAAEKSAIAEAAARRDFEKQKEAQIAQARVSQGLAIVNAYASGGNFLTGLALAATAAFVTERQIRGIKSQQFNGGASLTAAPSSAASGSTSASSGSTATGSSEAGQSIQVFNLNGVFAQTDTDTIVAQSVKRLADDGYITDSTQSKINTQNISTQSVNVA